MAVPVHKQPAAITGWLFVFVLAIDDWWLVVGGWWLVVGGWWLVTTILKPLLA
ncbi:hypothetical protein [Alcaligenes faecalis]|uniref:Uncharacterized protein n=1 Tax=Alcaligenes faecalis TaxID=511 RepID=A0AAE9KMX0_ALCFA|nr:hypothetical protein [Alcaligenes faecalis]UPL21107.1 hypothetical protein MXF72_17225 [Alcaligenes faecalis]